MKNHPLIWCTLLLFAASVLLVSCNAPGGAGDPGDEIETTPQVARHATTEQIDQFDAELAALKQTAGSDTDYMRGRLELNTKRWKAVQRAVAYQGTTHRDAFYGSRAYWHTASTRGLSWAFDTLGDLQESVYVDSPGNVRIAGDANANIEIRGDSIVHILGDLNATLELKGICEVVIAGNLTASATIICDGPLDLFVGGNTHAIMGATGGGTIIIDGSAGGVIQCGAPATTLTITGQLTAELPAPADEDAILTLRVDGFAPTSAMLDLATAGFTRVNATLGRSNVPPGLYPADDTATRPVVRWVVLEQWPKPD